MNINYVTISFHDLDFISHIGSASSYILDRAFSSDLYYKDIQLITEVIKDLVYSMAECNRKLVGLNEPLPKEYLDSIEVEFHEAKPSYFDQNLDVYMIYDTKNKVIM